MILLDTNYLIGALVVGSEPSHKILSWLERGEVLLTAMPAWYEFLCGPLSAVQIAAVRHFNEHCTTRRNSRSRGCFALQLGG